MATQLIYTSSPEGLTVGRTGFCTVMRSAQMPEKLAGLVEKFGIYEHFNSDPKPVAYSSGSLVFLGKTYYILTRSCDSGADYTNRSNFLAHHLVVCEGEITPNGPNPAEILLNWNGWRSSWDEAPHYTESEIDISKIEKIPNKLPAKTWKETFGSPAKAALLTDGEESFLVANPGDERLLLKLFAESLELILDVRKRWSCAFTTYFSGAQAGGAYRWKTLMGAASTPEGSINLTTRTAPPAPDTRAAKYATDAVLTNREKNNLQVSGPINSRTVFTVVDTKPKQAQWKIPAIFAGAAALIIALLAALFLMGKSGKPSYSTPEKPSAAPSKLESLPEIQQPSPAEQSAPQTDGQDEALSKMTFSQVKDEVRTLLDEEKFDEALKLWRASRFAALDPSAERRILGDIGEKIDSMCLKLESLILKKRPEDKSAAEELSAKIAAALKTEGLPRKQQRLERWEILNSKISDL